jgi:hypothetical protein
LPMHSCKFSIHTAVSRMHRQLKGEVPVGLHSTFNPACICSTTYSLEDCASQSVVLMINNPSNKSISMSTDSAQSLPTSWEIECFLFRSSPWNCYWLLCLTFCLIKVIKRSTRSSYDTGETALHQRHHTLSRASRRKSCNHRPVPWRTVSQEGCWNKWRDKRYHE